VTFLPSRLLRAETAFFMCAVLFTSGLGFRGSRSFPHVAAAAGRPQAQESEQKPKPSSNGASTKETPKPRPKRIVLPAGGWDLATPTGLAGQPGVVAAARGMGGPVALAPHLGRMYGAKPLFAWNYKGEAHNFTFVLRDDQDAELLRERAAGARYHPSKFPLLDPGKVYSWVVEFPGQLEPSQPAQFKMVSTEERRAIEQALAGAAGSDTYQADLARARTFTDHRLWYDAIGAYTDLIARYPHGAELYKERGSIYKQLEITKKLGEQDFAHATEIEKERMKGAAKDED